MRNISQIVEKLLSEMTLEEKVSQMYQISLPAVSQKIREDLKAEGSVGSYLFVGSNEADEYLNSAKKSRMKIPPIFGIDAIHGHAVLKGATVFPSQLAMACSFDEEMIEEMGHATALEVAADGHHWVFSPVLCIGRDLRWGRIDETFGEDALLISRLGSAIIKGYQKDGLVAACAKHYLAYGEATGGRDAYDSEITERKAREIFLKPFKSAIDAGCMTFMTAYGSIDSSPITASKKWMTDILKDELGFKGFAVTDWTNIDFLITGQHVAENMKEACAMGISAGNDMSMQVVPFREGLIEAVKDSLVTEERINDAVRRILTVKSRLGLLDNTRTSPERSVIGCREHEELNYRLTLESNVLLKNDGILPLKDKKTIAVIGPNADDVKAQYGDWTYFTHPSIDKNATPKDGVITVLRGITDIFDGEVLYSKGADRTATDSSVDLLIEDALSICERADAVIAVLGDDVSLNGENKDRANLTIPGRQIELLKRVKELKKQIIVVLINGKPLVLNEVEKYASAIIETFNGGDLSGKAVADLIFGRANFTGKLPISIPYDSASLPCYYNQYTYWHGEKYVDVPTLSNYPFGFGLSYSDFVYSELTASESDVSIYDHFTLSVDVTNESDTDGVEVVQLYYKDIICKIITPCRTLIDFKRVPIKAHDRATVRFIVDPKTLGYYNEQCQYTVDPGEFLFFVSGNGKDFKTASIRLKE